METTGSAKKTYTDDERADALALYAELGPAEVERRLGIPKGTVTKWAQKVGVECGHAERTRAATEQLKLTIAERRERVKARLWEIADLASEREIALLDEAGLRDVVGARTRAIHDAQLLAGEPTTRTAVIDDRPATEERIGKLVELRRAA